MKGFLYGQTEYNIKASITRLDDYIKEAKKCSFTFLSITDSNMHAAYKFYVSCQKEGIKPILGLEYTIKDEDQASSKLLLYAKNNEGYKNLLKITTRVSIDGFQTVEEIKEYLDGIYIIYVLDHSFIERLFKKNALNIVNEYLDKLKLLNAYLGISYINRPSNHELFHYARDYAIGYGVKVLPIHQCKYLSSKDSIVYEYLAKMEGKEIPDRFDDYSFLENPMMDLELKDFIDSIHVDLYNEKINLPKYPNTKGKPSFEYLYALCYKGLERRGKYNKEYMERLEYELSIIHRMGYDDYFLIVWDFIKYSKQNGILVGPGRGSAAGSLVAYCLGITEVDPLKYGLLFERFLNPERVSMPDIDTDFPDKDRDLVIRHVRDLYGEMHVCNITAFGTFKVKSSVRELSKVFHIEESRLDKIIDMIESRGYDALLKEYEGNELYDFLYVAKGLEGLPKHISTHAAGIILSEKPLYDLVPLNEGLAGLHQSQFEASDLEKIGLLKMDFLGISNLTMIDGMMKATGFDLERLRNIPLDDKKVYELLQNADTLGIFQMEKSGFRNALRSLKPTKFEDIVAMLALYRPGPMDNIPVYVSRKNGERFSYLHKDLEPILKETYGVIVYQEQIMKIAQVFAGYSLGEADLLRRAVSKKDATKLQAMSNDFITKCILKGYSREIAQNIYDLIYKFADYGFNKSHSVAYALFAYQMAFFKANYFNAFMSNIMNNVISDTKTLVSYISYAKARGLMTQKPNINVSTNTFVFVKNWLFMPLNSIKSIGDTVTNQIVTERSKNGLFRNFEDFKSRCSFLNVSALTALVYSGALDIFGRTKKSMLENSTHQDEIFLKYMDNKITSDEEYEIAILRKEEKEYLGLNLEYNPFRNIKDLYGKYQAIPLSLLKEKSFAKTLVTIIDMKEIKTKKGEAMLLGSIEDDMKTYRFTIFPKIYSQIPKGILKLNILYLMQGVLDYDNKNELCFTIQSLLKVEEE